MHAVVAVAAVAAVVAVAAVAVMWLWRGGRRAGGPPGATGEARRRVGGGKGLLGCEARPCESEARPRGSYVRPRGFDP